METKDGERVLFNEDGSMDPYAVPFYVSREDFSGIVNNGGICNGRITALSLGYMETVYGVYSAGESCLFGGTIDNLNLYLADNPDVSHQIRLVKGTVNGDGECMLHLSAERSGSYEIGDILICRDADGNELASLKISGFFIWERYSYVTQSPDAEVSDMGASFQFGSNPFYRTRCYPPYLIITDFDTVYNLYGNESTEGFTERHEFNKFSAWYTLAGKDDFAVLPSAESAGFDGTHSFYQAEHPYEKFAMSVLNSINLMLKIAAILLSVTLFILAMLFIVLLRERRYDMGIMLAVGFTKPALIRAFACESALYAAGIGAISIGGGWAAFHVMVSESPYFSDLQMTYTVTPLYILIILGVTTVTAAAASSIVTAVLLRLSPSALTSPK